MQCRGAPRTDRTAGRPPFFSSFPPPFLLFLSLHDTGGRLTAAAAGVYLGVIASMKTMCARGLLPHRRNRTPPPLPVRTRPRPKSAITYVANVADVDGAIIALPSMVRVGRRDGGRAGGSVGPGGLTTLARTAYFPDHRERAPHRVKPRHRPLRLAPCVDGAVPRSTSPAGQSSELLYAARRRPCRRIPGAAWSAY